MQKKYTIELIIDTSSNDNTDAVDELVTTHAVQIQAASILLNEAQRPQVICYADDYMVGRTEIDFMARKLIAKEDTDSGVSDEMFAAMQEMQK